MNKNNRSGGIKFRELDYSKSSLQDYRVKNNLRSKEDVLKLFADTNHNSQKENARNIANEISSEINTEVKFDKKVEEATENNSRQSSKVQLNVIGNSTKTENISQKHKTQSNVIDSSKKTENVTSGKKFGKLFLFHITL